MLNLFKILIGVVIIGVACIRLPSIIREVHIQRLYLLEESKGSNWPKAQLLKD